MTDLAISPEHKVIVPNEIRESRPLQVINSTLIVPYAKEPQIYPWGAHALADYVAGTDMLGNVDVLDLAENQGLVDLHRRSASLLARTRSCLKSRAEIIFRSNSSYQQAFAGVVGALGGDIIRIAARNRLLKSLKSLQNLKKLRSDLDAYKSEFQQQITISLRKHSAEKAPETQIWGISVYDYTLFDSLAIARLVHDSFPSSSIIFGGEHFRPDGARELMREIPWIDGVVVGPGEDTFKQIILARSSDHPIGDLKIRGFFNSHDVASGDDSAPEPAERKKPNEIVDTYPTFLREGVNVPQTYHDSKLMAATATFVRPGVTPGTVHVMTQRGCTWGKCTFCGLVDRGLASVFRPENIVAQLQEFFKKDTITKPANGDYAYLQCDSDETDPAAALAVIDFLNSEKAPQYPMALFIWFQVKMYSRDFAEKISEALKKRTGVNRRSPVLFIANTESLNPGTLKVMRKGHTPLKAIECTKVLQDICRCGTNYFGYYPLENPDNVASEVQFLEAAAHLFTSERGHFYLIPLYHASSQDLISDNQDIYRIKMSRASEDIWVKEAFGVNLPLHSRGTTFPYSERWDWNPDKMLSWFYQKGMANLDRRLRRIPPILGVRALSLSGKRKSYWRRAQLFRYLANVDRAQVPYNNSPQEGPGFRPIKHAANRRCWFYCQNTVLRKNFELPYKKENWQLRLSKNELKVLRFLYWTRKEADLRKRFENEINADELSEILARHQELGSIVGYHKQFLSVFHDPEYWDDPQTWE